MLCHAPGRIAIRQENICTLLRAGADVRFFDREVFRHPPYGLLVDGDDPILATAMRVERERKQGVARSQGRTRLYSYTAIRYAPKTAWDDLRVLSTLFTAMWNQSREAVVLFPRDLDDLLRQGLVEMLRMVSHYDGLEDSDLGAVTVNVTDSNVYSATLCVKGTNSAAYRDQGVIEFLPSVYISRRGRGLLLPPILEAHDGKLVVVDGTHRLFELHAKQQQTGAYCLVVRNRPRLPCTPVPFTDVRMWPGNLTREKMFKEYEPSWYRNFSEMEKALRTCRLAQEAHER